MFCPQCKAEYREGFYVCSDCKIPLVAELPKVRQGDPIEYVEIASVQNFTTLVLVKSLFESEDIHYFIWGEEMMNAGLSRGGGSARIFVSVEDEIRAKDLLDSLEFEGDRPSIATKLFTI